MDVDISSADKTLENSEDGSRDDDKADVNGHAEDENEEMEEPSPKKLKSDDSATNGSEPKLRRLVQRKSE